MSVFTMRRYTNPRLPYLILPVHHPYHHLTIHYFPLLFKTHICRPC